jgi:hypothetical protein
MTRPDLPDGCEYIIGDAVDEMKNYEGEAAAVFLDDAWARPQRAEQFGVEYDTHPFDEDQGNLRDHIDTSLTTTDIIDAAYESLTEGGWLIADADDWLLPRLIEYLQSEWGDVAASYSGGGYRKVGGVTYVSSDGTPDKSTAGMYLSTGGYPVVFAHKGETERRCSVSARQISDRQRDQYGWGSVKPLAPYEEWVDGLVEPGELVLVPCAGTAPAALAAELVFDEDPRYVCIDTEEGARDAFFKRRQEEVRSHRQKRLK